MKWFKLGFYWGSGKVSIGPGYSFGPDVNILNKFLFRVGDFIGKFFKKKREGNRVECENINKLIVNKINFNKKRLK